MTREQTRASMAWGHVTAIGGQHGEQSIGRKSYGTFAGKLPALLRSAGLCQTLHFLRAKRKTGKDQNGPNDMAAHLLRHLAEQLAKVCPGIALDDHAESLCKKAREAELPTYLWLSREAVACATWYQRLAKSELGIEPTDEPPGEHDASPPPAEAEGPVA